MDSRVPDIRPLLLRNLDALQVVRAAERLTADEPSRRAEARGPATLGFGHGKIPTALVDALSGMLATNLTQLRIGRHVLEWILAPVLVAERLSGAVLAISEWQFTGTVVPNNPPDPRMPSVLIRVHGEDAFLDLLEQPVRILSNLITKIHDAWDPVIAARMTTSPQLRTPDEVVAALEESIIVQLGGLIEPVRSFDHHFRFGTITTSKVLESDDAKQSPEHQLGFAVEPTRPFPWSKNVEFTIDESTKPVVGRENCHQDELYVDPYYGQVYSASVLANNEGLYAPGQASRVGTMWGPVSIACHSGWLNVPFRLVPRFRVNSYRELSAVLVDVRRSYSAAKNQGLPLLLRGQTGEHLLPRPGAARQVLFGTSHALEPSLLPSSTRRTTSAETFQAFAAAVQMYLLQAHQSIAEDEVTVFSTFLGDTLKLALGQHYGLASTALDWTTDPTVALWFALNRLVAVGDGTLQATPLEWDAEGVLYCLRPELGHSANVQIAEQEESRPSRQRGWVTHTAWGYRPNRVARYLIAAIYFSGSLRDELADRLPSPHFLFPGASEDRLVGHLHENSGACPNALVSAELRRDLYVV